MVARLPRSGTAVNRGVSEGGGPRSRGMHRWLALLALCSCANLQSPGGVRPERTEPEGGPGPQPVHLVATARVEVATPDVDDLVHAVRGRVEAARGHVTNEEVT